MTGNVPQLTLQNFLAFLKQNQIIDEKFLRSTDVDQKFSYFFQLNAKGRKINRA